MSDDKLLKQLKESWEKLKEVESDTDVLSQLNKLGFSEQKLNWMLNKVSDELSKEKEKTFNDTHNSSLEVILTDVQKLLLDILNYLRKA